MTGVAYDFGDAPASYGVAQHRTGELRLGLASDSEPNSQSSSTADGDDVDDLRDDDGVTFGVYRPGEDAAHADVFVSGTAVNETPFLNAWIDFNQDDEFQPNEQIAVDVPVVDGDNKLFFDIPPAALIGETFARFRLSNRYHLGPTGTAYDGEVEDYQLTISSNLDFGDAPGAATLLEDDGARHVAIGPRLGLLVDTEADGSVEVSDESIGDDEDGVVFGEVQLDNGAVVRVDVSNAPNGAVLDAWFDLNRDETFSPNEQLFGFRAVTEGSNLLEFELPFGATPGQSYARFRLSSFGDLAPTGLASDGEVEDHQFEIISSRPFVNGTTLVHLVDGNLVIEDVGDDDTADDITLSVDANFLVIHDPTNTLNSDADVRAWQWHQYDSHHSSKYREVSF